VKADENNARVFTVPAAEIARRLNLRHLNMVMLGALHKVYETVPFKEALTYYEKNVPKPREVSLEAIRQGLAETTDIDVKPTRKTSGLDVSQDFLEWRPEDHSQESWPSAQEELQLG
jgi:Pyruvate/2-oxoacid:ferredoxin oxidoreductase gamma subunit